MILKQCLGMGTKHHSYTPLGQRISSSWCFWSDFSLSAFMPLVYNSSPQVKKYLIAGTVLSYKTVLFTVLFLSSSADSKSSSVQKQHPCLRARRNLQKQHVRTKIAELSSPAGHNVSSCTQKTRIP